MKKTEEMSRASAVEWLRRLGRVSNQTMEALMETQKERDELREQLTNSEAAEEELQEMVLDLWHMLQEAQKDAASCQELREKLREAERDAKRYRWMRENWAYSHGNIFFDGFALGPLVTLDDAIDQAIAKEKS